MIEHLQKMTEALAAANTQETVFDIVLTPALGAIRAVTGVILLVTGEGQQLELAASKGHPPDLKSIHQVGPIDHHLPAGDALQRQEALFFNDPATLIRSYPALEPRTGTRAPNASAVLPLVLNGHALGVLILDFKEPHTLEADERRFLCALAAQCSIALGRVALARDLERRIEEGVQAAVEARRDTEILAVLGDALQQAASPLEVATLALPKLGPALHALNMLVVRLNGERIGSPIFWGNTPQEIADHMMRPDLTLNDTPLLQRLVETKQAVYLNSYHQEPESLATIPSLAVGLEPICLPDGTLEGCLVIWRPMMPDGWRTSEKGLLKRAANTLSLAMERARQAEVLREKNAELEARTQALEGFAHLSRDFSLEHDPVKLVGRAQELILSLLPDGVSTYYELQSSPSQSDSWKLVAHRGTFQDPALLDVLQRGVPRDSIPNIERPFKTHLPFYQQHFDPQTVTVAQVEFKVIQATAALPVFIAEQVQGILVVGLYRMRSWSLPERAVLETVVRSLGLALERSQTTRELAKQRDALDIRTQELAAANQELEAFSYSISHDLRTPVRHISGFMQLTRQALAGQIDAKTTRYLDVINESTEHLNVLIDALLELSRASRKPLLLRPVDLNEMMSQIQQRALPDLITRNIRWEVAVLPSVYGDSDALKQVLTQLTENALKFTRNRDPAVIKVWAEDQGEAWGVFVQDNGLGFDPRYQERLFNMFQRLHSIHEAAGTGVGLASVRRLILKHGGQVSAKGQVGEGATFGFTLPKSSPSQP